MVPKVIKVFISAVRCRKVSQPVRWMGQPAQNITGVIKASCSQWFSRKSGTQVAWNRSVAITGISTGTVSTAPTITRRDRSAISRWRSTASWSSVAAEPGSGLSRTR